MTTMNANELRVKFIKSRRSENTKKLLKKAFTHLIEVGSYQDHTEIDGVKIGERITYTDSRPCNGGLMISQKEGFLFGVGNNKLLIWNGKKIIAVKIK